MNEQPRFYTQDQIAELRDDAVRQGILLEGGASEQADQLEALAKLGEISIKYD